MRKFYLLAPVLLLASMQGRAQCTNPTVTVSGTDEICSGNSVTLTATSTADDIRWYNAATGGTQLGTGETFNTPVLSTTTSFWAEARVPNPAMGTPTSGGARVAPATNSGTTVNTASDPWGLSFNATQEFILNSVDVFLTSSTPGTVVLYFKDSSYNIIQTFNIPVPAGGTSSNPVQYTLPLNITVPVGNQYRLLVESGPAMVRELAVASAFPAPIGSVGVVTGGTINNNPNSNTTSYYFLYNWNYTPSAPPCISDRVEHEIIVNPTPVAPAAQEFSVCGSGTIADLNTDADILWYAAIDDDTPLAETTALTSNTFYLSRILGDCESSRTAVEVNVNPIPPAPAAQEFSICGSGTIADLNTDADIVWYAGIDDDTPLEETTTLTDGTFYLARVANGCESATRTAVEVNVNTIPIAPVENSYTLCGGGTIAEMIPVGQTHLWYTAPDAEDPLEEETALTSTTYYVSQVVNGCESNRTATIVTINEIPAMPDMADHTVCGMQTIAQVSSGNGYAWYTQEQDGDPLEGTVVLANGTYYVSQTVNGCESPRAEVVVTVNPVPDIPIAEENQEFAEGQTLADLIVDGDNLNWYADENGENALTDDTTLEDDTTYYVSQTINGCEGPLFAITVNNPLGISEVSFSGFACYPNPTGGSLNLTNSTIMENVSVYTLVGQRVYSTTINATEHELDLSALAAGTYIVTVQSGTAVRNTKIVKE